MCLQTALEFMLLLIQSAAKVVGDPAVYKQKISHNKHVLQCDVWKQRVKWRKAEEKMAKRNLHSILADIRPYQI